MTGWEKLMIFFGMLGVAVSVISVLVTGSFGGLVFTLPIIAIVIYVLVGEKRKRDAHLIVEADCEDRYRMSVLSEVIDLLRADQMEFDVRIATLSLMRDEIAWKIAKRPVSWAKKRLGQLA